MLLFLSCTPLPLEHIVLKFPRATQLSSVFSWYFCATFSVPTYHYEAPLFTLQLIEKGLSKIRRQSELIKVSLWHLSIAIITNLCAQQSFFFFHFIIQAACAAIENVSWSHKVI